MSKELENLNFTPMPCKCPNCGGIFYGESDKDPIVLIDIREIEVDRYLDFINKKRYIK